MPTNDNNDLQNLDNEVRGGLLTSGGDGDNQNQNPNPSDPESPEKETASVEGVFEKFSILKPEVAKYLKLIRDGHTLADLIKIYGVDQGVDENGKPKLPFGNPSKPENFYTGTEVDDKGNVTDKPFNPEDCVKIYEYDEDSGLSTDNRRAFFKECDCKEQSDSGDGSSTTETSHSVVNCENEITGGATFADFMIAKEAKFFEDKEVTGKNAKLFADKFFLGNNDEWGLNPEDAEILEKGGHQFAWNTEDELAVPRTIEEYKEYAKIIPDIDGKDNDNYLQHMVLRMQEIFNQPKFVLDDEETWYADFIYKIMLEFFADMGDKNVTAYYNKVAKGLINPESELEDGEYFINQVAQALVEEARKKHENPEFGDEEDISFVRGMILKYARGDDKKFNTYLRYGFGQFLKTLDDSLDLDLVDFIFNYQYKDAVLRDVAKNAVVGNEDLDENPGLIDNIAIMPEKGKDYDFAPNKDWTKKISSTFAIKEDEVDEKHPYANVRYNDAETEELDVVAHPDNWIDPAVNIEDKDGERTVTITTAKVEYTFDGEDVAYADGKHSAYKSVDLEGPTQEYKEGSSEGEEGGSSEGGNEGGSSTEPSLQPEPTDEEKAESQMIEPGNGTKVYVNAEGKIIDIEYPADHGIDQYPMDDLGNEELNDTVLEVVSETENEDGSWTVAYNIPGYTETYKAVKKENGTYKVDVKHSYIEPVVPDTPEPTPEPTPNPDDEGNDEDTQSSTKTITYTGIDDNEITITFPIKQDGTINKNKKSSIVIENETIDILDGNDVITVSTANPQITVSDDATSINVKFNGYTAYSFNFTLSSDAFFANYETGENDYDR